MERFAGGMGAGRARRVWAWPAVAVVFAMALGARSAWAIPAFARKTGMRCSGCHEAWPKLSAFGEAFKDNGYQIGNERDSPVWLAPLYWPIALRITPALHAERTNAVLTDQASTTSGGVTTPGTQPVTTQGFDLSGLDFWTAGVLQKDISFVLLPSSDEYGNFHFESAWVRFDNLLKSPWLNVKFGKFELDDVISEKRILTLSQVGGEYQFYHYLPGVDPVAYAASTVVAGETGVTTTGFGLGDNQLGVEVMGHSKDDFTRVSLAVLTSSDGSVNLPTNKSYDTYFDGSRAWNQGTLGFQRVGVFSYVGRAPTQYLTQTVTGSPATAIAGSGYDNKSFTRTGAYGLFKYKRWNFTPRFAHGTEDAHIALGIPSSVGLPAGVKSPTWNSRMLEVNYIPELRFALTGRYEDIRNSQQVFAASKKNYGDLDNETVSFRYYPFTTSRDGVTLHVEYSKLHSIGNSPIGTNQTSSSKFFGVDFAF